MFHTISRPSKKNIDNRLCPEANQFFAFLGGFASLRQISIPELQQFTRERRKSPSNYFHVLSEIDLPFVVRIWKWWKPAFIPE